MMQRLAFARLAARKKWNYISFFSISNSNNLLLLQSSLSNNPRFFFQATITDPDVTLVNDGENGVVPMDSKADEFNNMSSEELNITLTQKNCSLSLISRPRKDLLTIKKMIARNKAARSEWPPNKVLEVMRPRGDRGST